MATNRRLASRIFTRVRLLYGPQKPEADGYALNVSAEGLFISASRFHPAGTLLQIRLMPIGAEAIDLAGTVRWGQRVPAHLAAIAKPGMGIHLASPPRAYVDYFAALAASKVQRAHARVAARFEVRYYERQQFLKDYTENISLGGLFIATAERHEEGAAVRVELVIPDLATVIPLSGRVAYCLDAATAAALSTTQGIGVQITAMDPRAEELLSSYVKRISRLYE